MPLGQLGTWFSRGKDLVGLIRLRPFPSDTDAGRSKERYRRAALTSLASMVARGVTVATALLSVPLVLHTVGVERYGVWLTVSSLIAFLWVADLGVSRALVNAVSEARGHDDPEQVARVVSSAFFTLAGLSLAVGVLFAAVFPFVPWSRLFNVEDPSAQAELRILIAVVFICWMADWLLKIVPRVQEGRQEGYWNHLFDAGGRLLSLGVLVFAARLDAGLVWLAVAMAGVPVVGNVMNGLMLFGSERSLVPSLKRIDAGVAKRMFQGGLGFLGLDLSYLVIFNGCYLVISNVLGASSVAEFGVPARAFAVVNMLVALLVNPLWPAYAESLARGEIAWVKRTFWRSIWLTFGASLLPSVALMFLGRPIIALWVGDAVHPSTAILVSFGIWNVVFALGNTMGVFLNGTGAVRSCALTQIAEAAVVIPLEFLFAPRFGILGVLWTIILADLFFRVVVRALFVARRLRMPLHRSVGKWPPVAPESLS